MSLHGLLRRLGWLLLSSMPSTVGAVSEIRPTRADQVLEVLPIATPSTLRRAGGADAGTAAAQARVWIVQARAQGDNRYWGRAQAVLGPWWGRPDAPPTLAILQATVEQGRHAFQAARATLNAVLARDPMQPQAWLTLASLQRLDGDYPASLQSCNGVAKTGQAWYARACIAETQGLQAVTQIEQAQVQAKLAGLLAQAQSTEQAAWLQSLMAELQERVGDDARADTLYRQSLAQLPDPYTALAYSDMLLRQGRFAQALAQLVPLPDTDAVLLRRAHALRLSAQPGWQAMAAQFVQRQQAAVQRGEDLRLHAREAALAALWLQDDPVQAMKLSLQNLDLQKEPIDWWLALSAAHAARAAHAAKSSATLDSVHQRLRASGLHDKRLRALLP